MITKEIKQFVISQMKEADWETVENFNRFNEYKSRHINILHDTDISQKVTFVIKIYNSDNIRLNRKELQINYFYFRYLLKSVKKSCKLADKRKRESKIAHSWNQFLENNKDLKRDNKINQIID